MQEQGVSTTSWVGGKLSPVARPRRKCDRDHDRDRDRHDFTSKHSSFSWQWSPHV